MTLKTHAYYGDKCLEHLDRVMISHACAIATPADSVTTALEIPDEQKRKQLVNDIHFVALKTNFELFLMRSLRHVWLEYFEKIPHRRPIEVLIEKPGRLTSQDNLEVFVDSIVPQHGLKRLGEALEEVAGLKLPSVAGRNWPQIAITFGIRHLIEHGNGRVDQKFQREQETNWGGSSFHRDAIPTAGEKVVIKPDDIHASHRAMSDTVPLIASELQEWSKR